MAKARQEYDWGHTSSVLSMLHNCHRGPGMPESKPADFDPTRKKAPLMTVPITFLKKVFVKDG